MKNREEKKILTCDKQEYDNSKHTCLKSDYRSLQVSSTQSPFITGCAAPLLSVYVGNTGCSRLFPNLLEANTNPPNSR